eukprot:scaffold22804_cov74-Phaeocystis_antarctica.AAC.2
MSLHGEVLAFKRTSLIEKSTTKTSAAAISCRPEAATRSESTLVGTRMSSDSSANKPRVGEPPAARLKKCTRRRVRPPSQSASRLP